MVPDKVRSKIIEGGLKVTPQRMAVLEAILYLDNHPTAVQIVDFVRSKQPNIAVGTIYNALETFVEKKVITAAHSDRDSVRYDAVTDPHHHMYCKESEEIEDYYDEDLDRLLKEYFDSKKPAHFNIDEIRLQLIGKFKNQSTPK